MLYSLPRFCWCIRSILVRVTGGLAVIKCFVCLLAKHHSAFKAENNFRISVSPGSAEAVVRLGWKIKYHLTAYCVSNIRAKNYQNRLIYVKVTTSHINVFLGHSVS